MAEEQQPSGNASIRKDSNGKKAGKTFRSSTLFPPTSFVQQLGLDKLKARSSPTPSTSQPDSSLSQNAEGTQPDRTKTKVTTTVKEQDATMSKPITSSPQDNGIATPPKANTEVTQTPAPNKPVTPAKSANPAPPTTASETKNGKNENGKRTRGLTADTPSGVDITERPSASMRSNTVVPATRVEPKAVTTAQPTNPNTLKIPPLTTPGTFPLIFSAS